MSESPDTQAEAGPWRSCCNTPYRAYHNDDCLTFTMDGRRKIKDPEHDEAVARLTTPSAEPDGEAFDKALAETRTEYREALDRLAAPAQDGAEVEALAEIIGCDNHSVTYGTCVTRSAAAERVLDSDWLAQRDSARDAVVAAKALADAATEWGGGDRVRMDTVHKWLRSRAAALRPSEGSE